MPFTGQETQPTETVDVQTLQNNLAQSDGIDLQEEMVAQQSDTTPSYGDVTSISVRDWPTSSATRFVSDVDEPSDPNFKQPWAEVN